MLRFAQHDNMGVSTCHAERNKAKSKHLSSPMPNVHWITVVYLGYLFYRKSHSPEKGATYEGDVLWLQLTL